MKDCVQVRSIQPHELSALLDLYQHLHPTDAPLPTDTGLQDIWVGILSNPNLHYFVADVQGQLVGSCTLAVIPNLTRGARPYGIIENVVTHAAYRQQGIGTRVLQHALQVAWKSHCYKVMLLTSSKREEIYRFYEHAGFQRGIKTGFIAVPDNNIVFG